MTAIPGNTTSAYPLGRASPNEYGSTGAPLLRTSPYRRKLLSRMNQLNDTLRKRREKLRKKWT